jgi:hypothetical protein
MSQQSEERVPEAAPAHGDPTQGARILHMKSTHYDLQRAIQQRAQESVEREAQLDREERRPKPLKWLIIFAIACVPILVTLFMVDGFLRVFHRYLDMTSRQQQAQAAAEAAEASPETTLQSNQPGVVLLQPLTTPQEPASAEQDAPKGPTSDSSATQPSNTP